MRMITSAIPSSTAVSSVTRSACQAPLAFYLTDVGDGLREDVFLGRDGDHRDMVCDQGDGSMLNSPAA